MVRFRTISVSSRKDSFSLEVAIVIACGWIVPEKYMEVHDGKGATIIRSCRVRQILPAAHAHFALRRRLLRIFWLTLQFLIPYSVRKPLFIWKKRRSTPA